MTSIRTLVVMIWITSLSALAVAQSANDAPSAPSTTSATPPRVAPADAKNHRGEIVTVCGKVVDTKTSKYGIGGHGKPVIFDIDQPEPNPVFYFVTFGTQPAGPPEAIAAYQGKSVCVTGKVTLSGSTPYILADDRSKIKLQAESR